MMTFEETDLLLFSLTVKVLTAYFPTYPADFYKVFIFLGVKTVVLIVVGDLVSDSPNCS